MTCPLRITVTSVGLAALLLMSLTPSETAMASGAIVVRQTEQCETINVIGNQGLAEVCTTLKYETRNSDALSGDGDLKHQTNGRSCVTFNFLDPEVQDRSWCQKFHERLIIRNGKTQQLSSLVRFRVVLDGGTCTIVSHLHSVKGEIKFYRQESTCS